MKFENYGEQAFDVDTDEGGNIYVTGFVETPQFPGTNDMIAQQFYGEGWDAFVSMFGSDGKLLWSTYYGGPEWDSGKSIIKGNEGIYFAGRAGNCFPTSAHPNVNGYYQSYSGHIPESTVYDGFVVELTLSGTSIWSTYFGGYSGDEVAKIVEDGAGNLIIGGIIYEKGLIKDVNNDIVEAQIVAGEPVCSDPSTNHGFPFCAGAGWSNSNYSGGPSEGYLAKFDTSKKLVWSTFFGGDGGEAVADIVLDDEGNIYLTGVTSSTNFPTEDIGGTSVFQGTYPGGSGSAYISSFDSGGNLTWSTYFGSSDVESRGYSIGLNSEGDLYALGIVSFVNDPPLQPNTFCEVPSNGAFPLCDPGSGAFYDDDDIITSPKTELYISRFNVNKELVWSTYFGDDDGHEDVDIFEPLGNVIDVDFDAEDNIYVVGHSFNESAPSASLPVKEKSGYYYQSTVAGSVGVDAFIACFNEQNQDEWITYLGGSGGEWDSFRDFANGVSIDKQSNRLYVVGATNSNSFPTACPGMPAYCQQGNAGGFDAFVSRFDLEGGSTSIKEEESSDKSQFSIYPNPTSRNIVISSKSKSGSTFNLDVYNAMGQSIFLTKSCENCSESCDISMQNIPSGIYFIRMTQDGESFVQKLIKQ